MSSQKAMINVMMFYHWDQTLFDGMTLPSSVDPDDLIPAILEETSDLPVLITDLETLRYSINLWSKHRAFIWQHYIETTQYDYNPIENYDRTEVEATTTTNTGTGSVSKTGEDTNIDSTAAFNSSSLTEHNQMVTEYGSGTSETRNFSNGLNRTVTIHGNIGVTSSQDMIKQEREIADFDIIDIIVNEFKNKFCILIY